MMWEFGVGVVVAAALDVRCRDCMSRCSWEWVDGAALNDIYGLDYIAKDSSGICGVVEEHAYEDENKEAVDVDVSADVAVASLLFAVE
jgi:hypothetical protein